MSSAALLDAPAVHASPRPLTRAEIGARILRLPEDQQAHALRCLKALGPALERRGAKAQAQRDYRQRRRYAGDPAAYFADILGLTLTKQQEDVLEQLVTWPKVLIPSGNNLGKTFILGAWAVYRFDAVAALEDAETGEREQGARILLPGPDHDTVFQTVYAEMLSLARRAELRGHLMPGERSIKSVTWSVREKWNVEAFAPARRVEQKVSHTASGRHHRNQVALVEEGQGVSEATWGAVEGMCSSDGNQIISSFNPTEPIGAAFQRARSGSYRVIHLSAFNHPNVRERRLVIPAAVDFKVIDARVRNECQDRGPFPGTPAQDEHHDFLYALPTIDMPEMGARKDGQLGHPSASLRVYRPSGRFTAQVFGKWPASSESGLFNAGDVDAAMARWATTRDPATVPDNVGVDPAREGGDDPTAAPRWGDSADALLRLYAQAQKVSQAAIDMLRATRRARVGTVRIFPRGKGPEIATRLAAIFPGSPFTIDEGGIGASPLDYLTSVLHRQAVGVSFAETPLDRTSDDEPWSENMRTQLYVRAAMLTHRGLVDIPNDALLREELLAHSVLDKAKVVEKLDRRTNRTIKVREPSVLLIPKDEIKKMIGRSPDRADAFVLSLFNRPIVPHQVVQQTKFRHR